VITVVLTPAAASLPRVVLDASVAGIAVTTVFALTVVCTARLSDARRADRLAAATLYGALTVIGLAACAAAVVYGVILTAHKT
jgi:hypothetical protein